MYYIILILFKRFRLIITDAPERLRLPLGEGYVSELNLLTLAL